MPTLTLALLGASLLAAPAPVLAQRRLGWLAATRWGRPARVQRAAAPGLTPAHRALAEGWRAAAAVALAAGTSAGLAVGPVPGALAGLTGWALPCFARLLAAERRSAHCRADLAATVGALRDEYAAGATVGAAFTAAASVAGVFEAAVTGAAAEARAGHDVARPLRADEGLASLAVGCAIVARTGASLGQALAGVQADLAADQQTQRAVQAALAGPRSSALLLSALPVVGVALGCALAAHPERVLLHTTVGLVALTTGVVLDLAGLAWTLALSRRAVPSVLM